MLLQVRSSSWKWAIAFKYLIEDQVVEVFDMWKNNEKIYRIILTIR